MNKAIDIIRSRAIYAFLIIMVIFFTIMNGNFMTANNLLNVVKQVSIYGIASVGMTYVILLGGIDLSIGSLISFVNIAAAYFMVNMNWNPALAIISALIISTLIGFANGWIIAEIKMPPLIVTFASQTIFAGLAYIICNGRPISRFDTSFLKIGQGYIGVVPIPIVIMIVCFAVGAFILTKTYFGRYFYALGGNEEAAALSGINIKRVKYLVYALSGLFAGIAGIVMLSRANTGQPNAGLGYEFDVITCVVLGGVSVNGGSGKISNVIAGVLIIGVLSNGMILMDVSSYMQMVIKGIILLLAVGSDCIQQAGLLKAKSAA
ncbi:ABC transporter permease [Faecalicatena contorta]|uniref:Ribose transport system permease protein n=1 Tax=Faecalicatena contorta TaxID=39482 RepID=A0A315ZZ32_9FIRM|nr:ABC transporter permease [Faecalicatena contorta]PWJ50765.1 ribose transport system permease protein [Faecalicatena contorta]SUQ13333.1 ribose transport system permease protein [Faecalicatena contorta]